MQQQAKPSSTPKISREKLAELLNEDLSREYQAIIAYVVYSQVLKGEEFMSIADQLAIHAPHAKARPHLRGSMRNAAL